VVCWKPSVAQVNSHGHLVGEPAGQVPMAKENPTAEIQGYNFQSFGVQSDVQILLDRLEQLVPILILGGHFQDHSADVGSAVGDTVGDGVFHHDRRH